MARLLGEEELERIQGRIAAAEWAPAWARLQQACDALLTEPLEPPEESAGFYHNYFCPDHAVPLVFDATKPHAHRCPTDDRVFAGAPYDAAWRWFVNNRLSSMAWEMALGWASGGDARYLQRVAAILSGYAARYAGYEPSGDRPYGRGKATFQSLDEAVWLIPLTRAYDLVRAELAQDVRAAIEAKLLIPAAEFILSQRFNSIHNIECWHNAAVGAVGFCLDLSDWQTLVIEGKYGFRHQLREGVRDDGLWWEGSSSYHYYALAALVNLAQVVPGQELWAEERLARMFRTPVELAYPDLRQPATNDCWFSSSLLAEVCHGVPLAAACYEVAYGWYGDALYAQVLDANYQQQTRDSLEALLYGRALPENPGALAVEPVVNCAPSGLARFRTGGNYLLLKYGPHGGSHGHPDKLALSFYAAGYPLSPDLGTPGYGIALNDSWYRQTLSHNTVLVDACSQPEGEGEEVAFGQREGFAVADARVAWAEGAYAGVALRRVVLWRPDYFVDVFVVECAEERQLDWVFRVRGEREQQEGLGDGRAIELAGDGYEHIAGATAARAPAARLQWAFPGGHIAFHLPDERDTEIVRGSVPFNPAAEHSDILVRRRSARQTVFLAVVHVWAEECAVRAVYCEDGALVVEMAAERHVWMIGRGIWSHPGPISASIMRCEPLSHRL